MKEITEELKTKIRKSHAGISSKSLSWNSIYDTEEELINDMFSEKVITEGMAYNLCSGYEYIKGFRKYFSKNGELTEKQIKQLKRLAAEIAFCVYC